MSDATFWQSIATQMHARTQRYPPGLAETFAPASEHLSIVIVGAAGVGKSTLLHHLLHPLSLATGTTPWPVSVFTPEPPVLWTDTPGWTSDHANVIQTALAQADVCFWVVTHPDLGAPELAAILKNWGRPVVRVVNLRGGESPPPPHAQGNIIATVAVRLLPQRQPLRREWPDGRVEWDTLTLPADVTPLQSLVSDLLTHQQAIRTVNRLRDMAAQERVWASQQGQTPIPWAPVLLKSLLLPLSPGGWVPLAVSLATDLVTLVWLSRRLHLPITRHGIGRVVTALVISTITVGFLEVADGLEMGILGQGLWGGITSYGWQRVARTYLHQGMTWQADGPDHLLRYIYARLTPGSWLHTWIGEGLNSGEGSSVPPG
jgi:hypothetical protein